MSKEKSEELTNAGEQYTDILDNAREKVAEEKGKSMVSGEETLNEEKFEEYLKKHSEKEEYEYLVRGAKLVCSCGSHIRMLNLPECHGVYIGENPMVHENDCVQGIDRQGNISWFGICRSERSQELPGKKVCYELTEENSADGTIGETEPGKKCQPIIVGVWQDVYDKTRIAERLEDETEREKQYSTLTTGSFLVCNYGGIIQPVTSGQEYEMREEDLGDNRDADGNDLNPQLWNEIEEARKAECEECRDLDCTLAHERHMDGDETDYGNIHGTNYFTVIFQYEDGRIINKQLVKKGESAEIPEEVEDRDGYVFAGWNDEFIDVQKDLCICAKYMSRITYIEQQLEAITDISDWMERGYADEKLQTAKYLITHILDDKELLELGADLPWICGVLANMCIEGAPGLLEGISSRKYMQNAVMHGYATYKNKNGDILKDPGTIEALAKIANCTTHAQGTCGFGFGMFQWTFGRTGAVLSKYEERYSDYSTELTCADRFNVEWEYFKEEMRTNYYQNAITKYTDKKTGDDNEDAQIAAEIFRKWYEGNNSSQGIKDARHYASCWIEELKIIDWAEE